MFNPANLFKIKESINRFNVNHPKFGAFLNAASRDAIKEGSIITISVKAPDRDEIVTNLKVNKEDLELIEELKALK